MFEIVVSTGLCSTLQVRQETGTRVSKFVQLCEGHISDPRHVRHSQYATHQATLLWKPSFYQSLWDHSPWP